MTALTPVKSATKFKCVEPEFEKGKRVINLVRSDRVYAGIQYVKEGGENNLHSHNYMDGIYFVVKGRARFYGEHDAVIAEVGPNEGMLITRGFRYWFEGCGEEALEMLLIQAFDRVLSTEKEVDGDRVDHKPRTALGTPELYSEQDAGSS